MSRPASLADRLRALIEAHRLPVAGRLPKASTPRRVPRIVGDPTRTSWERVRTRQARAERAWGRAVKEAWLS